MSIKKITLWSLYERPRNSNKRWVRVSQYAYTKPVAIRVYQNILLSSVFSGSTEMRLRRVF